MRIQAPTTDRSVPHHSPVPATEVAYDRARLVDSDPGSVVSYPHQRRRGRAAALNRSGRFEKQTRENFDDGWDGLDDLPLLRTEVTVEKPRKIITKNDSPDISFDRSINPYRGCEHGCIYCFARPAHAFMGLSAGLDFETKLFAKPNAAQLLEAELAKPGYVPKTIAIGTNTDPYQPIEKQLNITRQILEVLERTNHPVAIVTKSSLILRDLDILQKLAAKNCVKVAISVTTLDHQLSRTMEPRAASPGLRLDTIKKLTDAGIPTAVMVAPVIPALNDMEIERILEVSRAHGAREAGYVLLRLPHDVAELFKDWLLRHYPDKYRHVMSLLNEMRGGKDYDSKFGRRMRGEGHLAWLIGRRFELTTKRLEMKRRIIKLTAENFVAPARTDGQLSLF
jgi:DNA repair photolyase